MVRTMIEMSPVNGIEIGRKLLRADPDVYLVYLAAHPEYEFESYKLEVDQYILKEEFWHLWECVSESGKKYAARREGQCSIFLIFSITPGTVRLPWLRSVRCFQRSERI